MDPDPVEHQPANLSRERPKPSLDKQRKLHRSEGLVKTMKKESSAVSIPSPSLDWKISRIAA
jgi:hypothetical protein